jgi:hypothetical protein
VPAPSFLRDAIDLLRKTDDRTGITAALHSLERIIRKQPAELIEVSGELIQVLLQLGSAVSFTSIRLNESRLRALIAITACNPVAAASQLSHSFYSESSTLSQRGDVLFILVSASEELSKVMEASQKRSNAGHSVEQKLLAPPRVLVEDVSQLRQPFESSLSLTALHTGQLTPSQSRTLSGGPKQLAGPHTGINRFASLAQHFFFPLLKHAQTGLLSTRFLAGEPLLFSRLLDALSLFLVFAGPSAPA